MDQHRDIAFIYVVNKIETKDHFNPFIFNSYARSHIQTTFQMMGCKQRDADSITNLLFDWLSQAKQVQTQQVSYHRELTLVDSDDESQEVTNEENVNGDGNRSGGQSAEENDADNDADNEDAGEKEVDFEESEDEWDRSLMKLSSSYEVEPTATAPLKMHFDKIRLRIQTLANQQTKWNSLKRLSEDQNDKTLALSPRSALSEPKEDVVIRRKMIKELAKLLHHNKKNFAKNHLTRRFYHSHCERRDIVVLIREQFDELVSVVLALFDYIKPSRLEDFRIACQVQERKRSVIVLFGGTSGTGKSTLASLLASRMGITKILGTDSVRHLLRGFITKDQEPCLFTSTYHSGEAIKHLPQYQHLTNEELCIEGYKQQCKAVVQYLDKIITNCVNRNEPMVVEGVHLTPDCVMELLRRHPTCVIPYVVYISKSEKHKERFAFRARYMTLEPRNNKYVKYFHNIRTIQQYICDRADFLNIPKIDNTNIDRSLAASHSSVFKCLKRLSKSNDSMYDHKTDKAKVVPPVQYASWSSRRMLNAIRKKRSSLSEHVDSTEQQQQQQQQQQLIEPEPSTNGTHHLESEAINHYQYSDSSALSAAEHSIDLPQTHNTITSPLTLIPKAQLRRKHDETGSERGQFADYELSSQSESSSPFHRSKSKDQLSRKHVPTVDEMFYASPAIPTVKKGKKKKKLLDKKTIFQSSTDEEQSSTDGDDDPEMSSIVAALSDHVETNVNVM
ncbi:hypothetical protein AKO1_006960 [Acrasis kona]|uniref:2-phosphoglycerate kinase n=1 Tax=Acrasis kona TaxID=1008807 RepID=A0AAW2YVG4_9EUKA